LELPRSIDGEKRGAFGVEGLWVWVAMRVLALCGV
jgi:hypothetical protein